MIHEAIKIAVQGNSLSYDMAKGAMDEIMEGIASSAQIASFLTAMRMKGESIEEITACASVMREKALRIVPSYDVMDIVGTGGDEAGTFNISTTSSFVVAASGIPVAKHGNRSVSSKSGAADVLEHLGINIQLSPEKSKILLDRIQLCFMFAPVYHSSMKYAAPVRKELGIRTIFNILGPLSNPAGASMQLMGVYDEGLLEPLAKVLMNLGVKKGMVIHGKDGLDEATLTKETQVIEINESTMTKYLVAPEDFGLERCKKEDLLGGDGAENALITRGILNGTIQGPKREIILLNAGLALYAGRKSKSIADGVKKAGELIDSGAALSKLEQMKKVSNEVSI